MGIAFNTGEAVGRPDVRKPLPCGEQKRQTPGVKHCRTALAFFAALSASMLAEDFKTINGKEYTNATVSRVEADGIVLRTKTGISKGLRSCKSPQAESRLTVVHLLNQ
jgi:hypothetical protein